MSEEIYVDNGRPAPPKKRAWVKLDKYLFDYFDFHDLSPSERHVMFAICLEVRWQDFAWHGSLTDLSGRTRMTRSHVKTAVNSLVKKGLLEEIHPFKSNNMGEFLLLNYFDFIIPELRNGGRPKGARDSYQRQRTEVTRTSNEYQPTNMRTQSEPETSAGEQIDNSNFLISSEKRYNSPREAEKREVANSVPSFSNRETEAKQSASNSPQGQNPSSAVPCKICFGEEWGHIWSTSDGRGHEYIPDLVGHGYVDF